MMHVVFLLAIVAAVPGVPSQKVCSYQDIVDYLKLTTNPSVFKVTRPVLDYTQPTVVELDVFLYAILRVIEKTQTFIPFLWITMIWHDERISWDPAQFCGISEISIPTEMLWKPDVFFYEMTQLDSSNHPFLSVSHDGRVISDSGHRVVSICKIDVHKFPFDTQRCTITVGSAAYHVAEMRFLPFSNSSQATQLSRELIRSQGEWEFLQLSTSSRNLSFYDRQWDQLVYTFTMRRRPILHIINFLLPILFFLCLDIASFFIADHRGEKLGFKVTVLLAVSVLLLILKDMLPATSNRTPLIATYCIVIFALMLLSLLETVLITYLMEKDSASRQRSRLRHGGEDRREEVDTGNRDGEEKRETSCSCVCTMSNGDRRLPVAEQVNNTSIKPEESHVLLLILEELKEVQETLRLHLGCRQEGGKSLRWAARIDRAFFIAYVITVSVFLLFLYTEWSK